MAGREVREYTNLSDSRDKKWGKGGKDKTDDEDVAFKRMVAKMQEVAGERGGYLHGRGALDSDDLLYLKEQMEAEEDAERLRRRTEKRAFAAFKISFFSIVLGFFYGTYSILHVPLGTCCQMHDSAFDVLDFCQHKAASLVDSLPAPVLQPLRVDPKPHTGIRQQVLVKSIVEIKPKRHRISGPTEATSGLDSKSSTSNPSGDAQVKTPESSAAKDSREQSAEERTNRRGILGLAYESSDDEEGDSGPENVLGKEVSAQSTALSKSTSLQ